MLYTKDKEYESCKTIKIYTPITIKGFDQIKNLLDNLNFYFFIK